MILKTIFIIIACFISGLFNAQAPINDNFSNAITLELDSLCSGAMFTNVEATAEQDENSGDCFEKPAATTVWFSFIAPENGNIRISTDITPATLEDTEIAVYYASEDSLTLFNLGEAIACDQDGGDLIDFNSILDLFNLIPGDLYFIQVNGYKGLEGDFCIDIQSLSDCPAPRNIIVSEINQNQALLTWQEVIPSNLGSSLSLYKLDTMGNIISSILQGHVNADSLQFLFTGLEGGTNYKAAISSLCTNASSTDTAFVFFKTTPQNPLCDEVFYDTGGMNENYGNNENYSLLISPPDNNTTVSIEFVELSIEEGFDFIHIYDGGNDESTRLSDEEDGVLESGEYFSSSPGGSLYLTFTSDSQTTMAGWKANVNCITSLVKNSVLNNLKISPNPTHGLILISNPEIIKTVIIYNQIGIAIQTFNPDTNILNADLSELSPGLYYLKINIGTTESTYKLLRL